MRLTSTLVVWFIATLPGAVMVVPVLLFTLRNFRREQGGLFHRLARSHLRRASIDLVILWNGVAVGIVALFLPHAPAVPQTALSTLIVSAGLILIQLLVTLDVALEYRLQRAVF